MSEPRPVQPVPLASTEEMEALIAKALHRWRAADVPDSLLAKTIMSAIQCEVLRAKDQIVAMLMQAFRGVGK